jgi:hypothetical protein
MIPKHKLPEDFSKKARENGSEKNKDEGVLCWDEEGCMLVQNRHQSTASVLHGLFEVA